MQSLYPYINDPTYGERVKAKMQEGYDIILGYQTASGVDPMGSDYTFLGNDEQRILRTGNLRNVCNGRGRRHRPEFQRLQHG